MTVALTRAVSPRLADCELTHLERIPIDVARAREQHAEYERTLAELGCVVERLDAGDEMPDSVFIEDIAVVLDEFAVVMRPGAASRRVETPGVAAALARHRSLLWIQAPATIDGGDVLVCGRRIFIGRSSRTSDDATAQLHRIVRAHGYTVCAIPIDGCLHLKSAVTCLGGDVLLANSAWLPPAAFKDYDVIDVDAAEPMAANALRIGDRVIFPTAFPRTAERLARRGFDLRLVDASELAKAEGAVTCCSVIIEDNDTHGR